MAAWIVTEQVRLAHALRESEERLRMVGDHIPGGMIYQNVTEPDGTVRYTYISQGVERLFGLTVQSVMADATRLRRLVWEGDQPQIARAEQEALRNSAPFDCEFRWRNTAGEIRWVHCRSTPCRLADGAILWNGAVTDITARKQFEEEASIRQRRLGMALEAAGMVTWEWDIPTRAIRYSNNLAAMVRGQAVEPYCSLDTLMLQIHPEDRERVARSLDLTSKTGYPWECEYRARMVDGSYRWILGEGKLVVVESGAPVGVQGLSLDITERKEAEAQLRRSEARFRLLADTAGRLLATQDIQGLANQLCHELMRHLDCQLFLNYLAEDGAAATGGDRPGTGSVPRLHLHAWGGISEPEARQLEWLEPGAVLHGCPTPDRDGLAAEDLPQPPDPATAVAKSHGIRAYCCHPLLSEGQLIGTLAFGTATRPSFSAEEVELMRVLSDQMAVALRRLKTLQALEAARAEALNERNRLAVVMETLPVGVCILDAQGGIVRSNPAYRELWGGPLPPVRGVSDYAAYEACWAATGKPLQPEEWASARALQHGEVVVNQELQIQRFDGTRAYVLNSGAPIRDAFGRVTGCAVAIRDITDYKQAEDLHDQLELQMQRALKEESLGLMAGGIAHDFNNLLAVILGGIGLAAAELPGDSLGRRVLAKAEEATHRAAGLCQQMLAYVGKSLQSFNPMQVNQLLQDVGSLVAASVSKGAQVRWNLAERLPLVSADAQQIRQLVLNLVINASEALGDRPGLVSLRTGSAARTALELQSAWVQEPLPAGEYVFLEVADTGCGIEAAVLPRIFDPFFSTKFTGRGLGLAAVLGIVRSHRGTIHVESVPGVGSTFRVWLPGMADPG